MDKTHLGNDGATYSGVSDCVAVELTTATQSPALSSCSSNTKECRFVVKYFGSKDLPAFLHQAAMFRSVLVISFLLLPTVASGTTVLLLKDGGTLEGELLNPDEISRKTYRIETTGGLEITLDARLVERVQNRERPAVIEYNAEAPFSENTIESHLYWARWCGENQLPEQARLHWRQILELDPEHVNARQILGYIPTPNGWVSQRGRMEDMGLIQYQGRWRTAQQIEVESILETERNTEEQWRRTIRDLTRRLPNPQAEAELLAIHDPAAFIPLRNALVNEGNPYVRTVLLRSLARIPHVGAVRFVVGWSIRPDEPSEDIRQMCVDELLRLSHNNPEIQQIMIDTYRGALRSGVEPVVHLAARTLGEIGGYAAVPELIDALVVLKTETIQEQPQSYTFGPGGTSLGQGSKSIRTTVQVPNHTVLAALTKLTGVNFQFDQASWQEWYRQTQRSPTVNLRRN